MKIKTHYSCQECGAQSPFWVGKCAECGAWNSFVEESRDATPTELHHRTFEKIEPQTITDIVFSDEDRLPSGIPEFDRILGGGIVQGSLTLIGGDPGIGKSTLLLQVSADMARQGLTVLYVSGEESTRQVKLRADRLETQHSKLYVVSETNTQTIAKHIESLKPGVVVIDSIQVVFKPDISSSPGSVAQVRECAASFMYIAKNESIPIFLVGHVTKEGAIAGPRVLEHIVDTVLYFEGDRNHNFRILRAVKNRFGATNEIGVFEMREKGLSNVQNPSEMFLSERADHVSGSVVVVCMEGTRPFLVEIQALVSSASGFGAPRRTTTGIDGNRVSMLLAVLEKRGGLNIRDQDVFVNVVGGIKVVETSVDLGLIMALRSSFLDRPVPSDVVFCAEVGLGGEVRGVSQVGTRLNEAKKLGFRRAVIAANNMKGLEPVSSFEITPIKELSDVLELF